MPGRENDPIGNYNFLLEIDGVTAAQFSEVSGLELSTEVIEYRSGGLLRTSKLPGRHSVGDVTLKRGYTSSTDLWDWYKSVRSGDFNRRNMALIVLDEKREATLRWNLSEAWPRRYVGPVMLALGNDVAIEELTIVCEDIDLA